MVHGRYGSAHWRSRQWLVPWALVAVLSAIFTFSPAIAAWGMYQRDRLLQGAFWQLVTAHWVHLSAGHAALNLAALALLMGLLDRWIGGWRLFAALHGAGCLLLVALAWSRPDFSWYAGLSGALHGVAAYGAATLVAARHSRRLAWMLAAAITLGLAVKLALAIPSDSQALDFALVAHAYGVVCGLAWALSELAARRLPKIRNPWT